MVFADENRSCWEEYLDLTNADRATVLAALSLVVIQEERFHVSGRVVGVEAVREPPLEAVLRNLP